MCFLNVFIFNSVDAEYLGISEKVVQIICERVCLSISAGAAKFNYENPQMSYLSL